MNDFRLGEPFELWGTWWLPEAPQQRIAGQLSSALGHLQLKLLGSFTGLDINDRNLVVPVIHGVGQAKQFTIWRAVQNAPDVKFPGGVEQRFHMLRVVIGAHLKSETTQLFSSVAFDAKQIGPWMVNEPVQQKQPIAGRRMSSFEADEDRARDIGPTKDGIAYRFSARIRTRHNAYLSYGFETQPSVLIEFSEAQTCNALVERVERTAELLTLLVGEDVEPEAIRLGNSDQKFGLELLYEFPPPAKEQSLIRTKEVLAPLPRLDDFQAIIERWDGERRLMGDAVKLLIDVLDRNSPPSHVRMLLLAQALEAFHRNTVGSAYLSTEEYEPIRRALTEAIPTSVKDDHRSSLKSRIKFGNELSLRTRLKQLLSTISDDSLSVLRISRSHFVNDVVDARNDFTHWVSEREPARPEGASLANLLSSLLAVTQLLILKHLGVSEELVVDRMRESPWRYLRKYENINPAN